MAKELAVILSDGSLEAAVIGALAKQKFNVAMVHFAGEGPAVLRRRNAFDLQVASFAPTKTWIAGASGVGDDVAPRTDQDRMFRLLPAVALACRAAGALGATAVYIPLRVGPDGDALARGTEFVQIWNELLQLPCGQEAMEITCPVLELEPWQVIDLAFQILAPLDKTWSCDLGGELPCGLCAGCLARSDAFLRAAKPDPLAPKV